MPLPAAPSPPEGPLAVRGPLRTHSSLFRLIRQRGTRSDRSFPVIEGLYQSTSTALDSADFGEYAVEETDDTDDDEVVSRSETAETDLDCSATWSPDKSSTFSLSMSAGEDSPGPTLRSVRSALHLRDRDRERDEDSSGDEERCRVAVVIRIRPHLPGESSQSPALAVSGNTIKIVGKPPGQAYAVGKRFRFDHVFHGDGAADGTAAPAASQAAVYGVLGPPLLANLLAGYNTCLLCYGQTGSGKTHTMNGTPDDPGLVPRYASDIFRCLRRQLRADQIATFSVRVSYLEIYREQVHDLLCPDIQEWARSKPKRKSLDPSTPYSPQHRILQVRQHPTRGCYVEGLSQHAILSADDVEKLISQGNAVRAVASTRMNNRSSRSHAIVVIEVEQHAFAVEGGVEVLTSKASRMHLVDLAGSERINARLQSQRAERVQELTSINLSLTTLGQVINVLATNSRKGGSILPPYRESTLTWLLMECFGGNAKTSMVATASPALAHLPETLSTLRYATRARTIVNEVVVNEDASCDLVDALRRETEQLRAELLERCRQTSEITDSPQYTERQQRLRFSEGMLEQLEKEVQAHRALESQLKEGRQVAPEGELLFDIDDDRETGKADSVAFPPPLAALAEHPSPRPSALKKTVSALDLPTLRSPRPLAPLRPRASVRFAPGVPAAAPATPSAPAQHPVPPTEVSLRSAPPPAAEAMPRVPLEPAEDGMESPLPAECRGMGVGAQEEDGTLNGSTLDSGLEAMAGAGARSYRAGEGCDVGGLDPGDGTAPPPSPSHRRPGTDAVVHPPGQTPAGGEDGEGEELERGPRGCPARGQQCPAGEEGRAGRRGRRVPDAAGALLQDMEEEEERELGEGEGSVRATAEEEMGETDDVSGGDAKGYAVAEGDGVALPEARVGPASGGLAAMSDGDGTVQVQVAAAEERPLSQPTPQQQPEEETGGPPPMRTPDDETEGEGEGPAGGCRGEQGSQGGTVKADAQVAPPGLKGEDVLVVQKEDPAGMKEGYDSADRGDVAAEDSRVPALRGRAVDALGVFGEVGREEGVAGCLPEGGPCSALGGGTTVRVAAAEERPFPSQQQQREEEEPVKQAEHCTEAAIAVAVTRLSPTTLAVGGAAAGVGMAEAVPSVPGPGNETVTAQRRAAAVHFPLGPAEEDGDGPRRQSVDASGGAVGEERRAEAGGRPLPRGAAEGLRAVAGAVGQEGEEEAADCLAEGTRAGDGALESLAIVAQSALEEAATTVTACPPEDPREALTGSLCANGGQLVGAEGAGEATEPAAEQRLAGPPCPSACLGPPCHAGLSLPSSALEAETEEPNGGAPAVGDAADLCRPGKGDRTTEPARRRAEEEEGPGQGLAVTAEALHRQLRVEEVVLDCLPHNATATPECSIHLPDAGVADIHFCAPAAGLKADPCGGATDTPADALCGATPEASDDALSESVTLSDDSHDRAESWHLLDLDPDLIVTGGSDCHGYSDPETDNDPFLSAVQLSPRYFLHSLPPRRPAGCGLF